LIITHSTRQLEVQITKPINLIYMTTNRISYIVFIKESDMRCLQSFCYIFCGSKFFPTCRADDYSEFSRNLATVWRRAWIIRVG